MNGGVLLAVFILAASTASEARQRFDREPEQREVNPGENTVMTCRVYEKDSKSICIWQKDGKPIRLQDGKYEWDGSRQNGDCSLRILNADIKFDDGEYLLQLGLEQQTGQNWPQFFEAAKLEIKPNELRLMLVSSTFYFRK